jgi:hypothetical protein
MHGMSNITIICDVLRTTFIAGILTFMHLKKYRLVTGRSGQICKSGLDKKKSGFGSGSTEQNSKTSAHEDFYPSTDPEETAQKKNYRPWRGKKHGKSSSPLEYEAAPIGR